MPGDVTPAPSAQVVQALRDATGDPALEIANLIVFYQTDYGDYGALSNLCCDTHKVALVAAGLYKLDNVQPSWIEPYSSS